MQIFPYHSFGNGQVTDMTEDFCIITMMYGQITAQIMQLMFENDWEHTGFVDTYIDKASQRDQRNYMFRKIHRVS